MPCNWSTTAGFLLQGIQTRVSAVARARPCYAYSQLTPRAGSCTTPRRGLPPDLRGLRGLSTLNAVPAQQGEDLQTTHSLSSSIRSTSSQLSSAQVSRAAAQAVRLSVHEGNYGDALYVVNSACQSVLQGPLDGSGSEKTRQDSPLPPIDFGCAVSPRLAAHAFLHGLLRGGYTKKAGTYAQLMIRVGIPIRTRTLESIVSSIVSPPSTLPKLGPFARLAPRPPALDHPSVLQLRRGGITDECARAAFDLLQEARTFGQRRTERMYRNLIETLIMQGEILVASLLFVLLLKDYEVQRSQNVTNEDPGRPNYVTHAVLDMPIPSQAALTNTPYPNPKIMGKILEAIDANRHPGLEDGASQYLQSLAIFAMLLDTGQICNPRVAALVSSIYRYPRTSAYVWILRDGKPVRVLAYDYLHGVLIRLIESLSAKASNPAPKLSRRTYNSLLTYALRHRLSPKMASAVLQHMCVERDPPLEPDIVTYNILLRSGSLLRKMSITKAALAALCSSAQNRPYLHTALKEALRREPVPCLDADPDLPAESDEGGDERSSSLDDEGAETEMPLVPSNSDEFSATLHRLQSERLILPENVKNPRTKIRADKHTLSSFILHLTSTGRPDAVAAKLFKIIPELAIVDHPATGAAMPSHIPLLSQGKRRKAMKRAVARGPYIYASLISALGKAQEVGLAERVFILGQLAERASHTPDFAPGISPWRLTIHAYTALMQAYAHVVRGKLPLHKQSARHVGNALLEQRPPTWRPAMRHARHGYARFVYLLNKEERQARALTKPQIARRNALLLYRSFVSGGRSLLNTLIRNSTVRPLRQPRQRRQLEGSGYQVRPDARFFNAALKLFAPRTGHHARRRSAAYWHRRMERAATADAPPARRSPMLHRLAKAMVASGFDVPIAYRQFLVGKGRWDPAALCARRPRQPAADVPYAFPMEAKELTHTLPAYKRRGLPIRRKVLKCMWKARIRQMRRQAGSAVGGGSEAA